MSDPGEISVLEPAGIQAERIRDLLDAFLAVSIIVIVLVLGSLVIGLRRQRGEDEPLDAESAPEVSRRKARAVGAATAATVITLVVLLVMSVVTGRALASLSLQDAVPIEITAHRWWWDVRYPEAIPADTVRTAYEIHVPVGHPVELRLASHDVIHSFWVPSLGPKRDLIPGKPTTLVLRADRAGVFDGMCAEYCGLQHANMRIRVVAEPQPAFQAWLAKMRAPAPPPATDITRRGQDVFLGTRCAACHAIRGTAAFGAIGPDLTHLTSRPALGMGTLPNDADHLRGWLRDPQQSKPGVIMPNAELPQGDLDALVAYMRSLE